MDMQVSSRQEDVAGDLLTPTCRVTGEVALRGKPLLDELNDQNALFTTLERMFVSALLDPATLIGSYASPSLCGRRLSSSFRFLTRAWWWPFGASVSLRVGRSCSTLSSAKTHGERRRVVG
jgi:hypothetical protein